jgi:hypothetical protein
VVADGHPNLRRKWKMTHVIKFRFQGEKSRKKMTRYHKDLGKRVLEIFNSDEVPDRFKCYVAEILEEAERCFPFEIRTMPPLTQKARDLLNDDQVPRRVKVCLTEILEKSDWPFGTKMDRRTRGNYLG